MWRRIVLMALLLMALGIVAAQPALAQNTIVWDAAFYNNPNLYDVPALRRQDASINFNWGAGSPGPGVNADDFSVRWGTDVYLNTGTYRFTARADDAIRIWIDYGRDPLINTWDRNQVDQVVTADIYLIAGTHHIQVDYREFTGVASAFASVANISGGSQPTFPIPTTIPPVVVPQPVPNGQWTAQYFANTSLSGSPSLIQSENTPTRNWGNGSPAPSIPADNWSARWTTIQYLNAGNYQLSVRADDGVRVFIDGLAVVNEWHQASDQTYTANLNLTAGQHSFLVEFYEAGGLAYLEYSLGVLAPAPAPTAVPPVVVNPTGLTATVTAGRLNVRDQPNAFNGRIIRILTRNETFPVVASNTGNTWVQLNMNGQLGWVNAGYVRLNQAQTQPPTQIPPGSTGYSVVATPYAVNIRNAPNVSAPVVARLPLNSTAPVLGRNFDSTWWQVSYNGIVGWVSAPYAPLLPGSDAARIPISL